MQSHRRGRTVQGLTTQRGQPNSKGPSWWGRLASVIKTRQNLRSRKCSRCSPGSEFSDVLTAAAACFQTELWFIQQVCFHTGKVNYLYRPWVRIRGGKKRPFGSSMCMSRYTWEHVCVTVRKHLYSQWRFYPWVLQLKTTTTYFLLRLHQTWHFKSLRFFVCGFFFSFKPSAVLNLRWMLLSFPSLVPSLHF